MTPSRHSDDFKCRSPTESDAMLPTYRDAEPTRSTQLTPSFSGDSWDSESAHAAEGQPLLRNHTPPPQYDEIDTPSSSWQAASSASRPNPQHELPTLQPDQHIPQVTLYPAQQTKQQCRMRGKCAKRRVCMFILCSFIFALTAVGIYTLSYMVFGCPVERFNTRNYHIDTLDYFEFSDDPQANSGLPSKFRGTMNVLNGDADQTSDLIVRIRSTKSNLKGGSSADDVNWRPSKLSSCAEVSLYFRPGLELSHMRISIKRINLLLSSDIKVVGNTTISIEKGKLVSESLSSSREVYIYAKSTAISGTFDLLDLLSISTKSGSVSIDVEPREALEGQPKPAVLELVSKTGAVRVNYPLDRDDLPDRDYRSKFVSKSGAVSCRVLHGSQTTVEVKSASLDAEILPHSGNYTSSTLKTTMSAGYSSIKVLSPRSQWSDSLPGMVSSHSAQSGAMVLRYPEQWEGQIHGESQSGSLQIHGNGVKIVKDRNSWGTRVTEAEKGHGDSKMDVRMKSGSADVSFG